MRSRWNLALVGAAGLSALVLTAIRQSPQGVVSLDLEMPEVRAAPGEARVARHDLSTLKVFNWALLRIKDRYVDPTRVDPKKMLYAALDSVQYDIPEVLVESDEIHNKITVAVNDKSEVFDTADVDSPWRMTLKLRKVFRFIETNMNAGADLAKVEYAAVNGMLTTLDPHSVLMDPEAARDMDVSTSGKFGGLGIVIKMKDRKLTVVKPMKDTPAWTKIKAGDHIVKINNEPTENFTSSEAVDRMRGEPKTAVTLWIERAGTPGLMRFDLVRDLIRVTQVEHKLLDKGVGYIKVKQFSKNISDDVADAMKEMSAKGATSWILDLRGNPGGLLEEAVQLSDLFVDSGTIVATVSGRDREARRAQAGFGDTGSSLAVLVNGNSASASEIVAGALKNLDRAVIIGSRTFGKGTVQELYDNDDKSKLKLTIAQYLTPGDRSIQNVGIVPDVQLQRMYVPDKNTEANDWVRLLAPTHTYGEKDLDAALVSSYAKDTDKPAFEVPFVYEKPKDADPAAAPPSDDDDNDDEDDIKDDFEMRFARDLVSGARSNNRPKLVASAAALVKKTRAEQDIALVAELNHLGIDWSAAADTGAAASLDVSLAMTPSGTLHAGEKVTMTATVKNSGAGTAYRVLARVQGDDPVFEDTEMPIGKLAAGETKTFTKIMEVPADALDRVDRLGLEVKEARNAPARVTPAEVRIEAAARPMFAYSYQLVDDGNGDGLVQRGEKFRLLVNMKNTGTGATQDAAVLLRNATGDGVNLSKSRFELKDALVPGATKQIEFPLATDATLDGDEMIVELIAYDGKLDEQTKEKLHFKVMPSVAATPARGDVTVKAPVIIRSGASDSSDEVGLTQKGASYAAIATFGSYTKVKLDGSGRVGFVPTSAVSSGGSAGTAFSPTWNSTPPAISLSVKDLETTGETYKIVGTVTDESHVEDVYVFVSNERAKIDSRKVFYRSNRGGKDSKYLEFGSELPLWPGSNMITVVARSSAEVKSIKRMFVYRDPPRTASKP
ncbi:MAG TPA: MXAN_5808 family serine peptidase [Kofleriaceae bacterium]|jgi:carboxyl-terminal processing protease